MRTSSRRRSLPAGLALGAAALLASGLVAGCQTGSDTASEPTGTASSAQGPTDAATESAEPTEPTEPAGSLEPTDPGEPVVNATSTLTAPTPGQVVQGPTVTVTGEATAFEATLVYQVLAAGTQDVVAEGWTQGGSNGDIGPFSFDVELEPGEYTVQVWEPDMSDGASGEVGPRNMVEATFTVL